VPPAQAATQWLEAWTGSGIVFVPDAELPLAALARPAVPIALLIGPEGGLDEREIRAALARGFHPVRFGPRVLRTETAAAAALAVLQSTWGDAR
jgi:16S rRNA (uracil1498-N3)-methyltransferase